MVHQYYVKMNIQRMIFLLSLLKISYCDINLSKLFEEINENIVKFNGIGAEIEWSSNINPSVPGLKDLFAVYQTKRLTWQMETCEKLNALQSSLILNQTQERQVFLLCGQPIYSPEEARSLYDINEKMMSTYYNAELCIPYNKYLNRYQIKSNITLIEKNIATYLSDGLNSKTIFNKTNHQRHDAFCLELKDIEKLAAYSRNEAVLKWIWLTWRDKTGPSMRHLYKAFVNIKNRAARRHGDTDIGESWRLEMEIPNIRHFCHRLYKSIQPLYMLLHGVIRYYLKNKYGDVVPARGPIPSHLLGNLWMPNWESLTDLVIPNALNLDESMKNMKWSVKHMVKRTEDFYISLGLPAMTDIFWRKSVFTSKKDGKVRCHGTAADMYKQGDYRLLYCSGVSLQDFNVLHHEMGHIEYYMAYAHQPGLFRQANSAIHESIGEAIMFGVITPQHLNRLGLINDTILYSTNLKKYDTTVVEPTEINKINIAPNQLHLNATTEELLLLKRALNKLPQIPFLLLIDEYRLKYFEGGIDEESLNKKFWDMSIKYQGISPPDVRGEESFDFGAIYYVADNTPGIRYFLSHFLQHQLFEKFCRIAVFGNARVKESLPKTIALNKCDIYGAKAVGKSLKNLMSRGNSQHWRKILKETTDEGDITAKALLRYYKPLQDFLTRIVLEYEIPIGW